MTQDRFKCRVWNPAFERMAQVDSIIFDMNNHLPQYAVEVQFRGTPDHYEMYHNLGHGYDNVLMQSTGLHDKNGKLIYEGDVVKAVYQNTLRAVEWVENYAAFSIAGVWPKRPTNCKNTDWEVIGNIHEHPELLKGDV